MASTREAASSDPSRRATTASSSRTRPSFVAAATMSLSSCLKDRRSGHELRRGLREPVLQLQRFRIERDDRIRLAVAARLAGTDRGDERAVRRERHGADDAAAVRLPRHDGLRIAVEIDRPHAARRAAAVPPTSPRTASCSRRSGDDQRELAGRNGAGRWMSLPDGRPTTCSMPSLEIDVAHAGRPEEHAERLRPLRRRGAPGIRSAGGGPPRAAALGWRRCAAAASSGAAPPDHQRPVPDRPRALRAGTPSPGSPSRLRYPTAPRPKLSPWRGSGGRRVQPDDARCGRGDPSGAAGCRRRQRRVEMPLPHDVAGVVVDPVDVVRTAGHDRHRHEQRHAARADALRQTVHAARLVVEFRLPLQVEAWLRQRRRPRSCRQRESMTCAAHRPVR